MAKFSPSAPVYNDIVEGQEAKLCLLDVDGMRPKLRPACVKHRRIKKLSFPINKHTKQRIQSGSAFTNIPALVSIAISWLCGLASMHRHF